MPITSGPEASQISSKAQISGMRAPCIVSSSTGPLPLAKEGGPFRSPKRRPRTTPSAATTTAPRRLAVAVLLFFAACRPAADGFSASPITRHGPRAREPHSPCPSVRNGHVHPRSYLTTGRKPPFRSPFAPASRLVTYPRFYTRFDTALPQGPLAVASLTVLQRALEKFRSRPGTYLLIPVVAAGVGWLTNWLAVQMIFYPVRYWGVPLYRRPEVPLGLVGWQGIVPCKTEKMTKTMVSMVTSQLLSVQEAFGRLDPRQVAALLAPEMSGTVRELLSEVVPHWMSGLLNGAAGDGAVRHFARRFLADLTVGIQRNIDSVLSLQDCVVSQMLQDRSRLGILFRKCGQKELDFLVNSGLWFGFLLGLIQMAVALVWENPWSLSIGGGIVGLATNWLALKWIFEPVDEIVLGPVRLQGMFLRRQPEVAREFSGFFASKILTAEQLWKSVLTNPNSLPAFSGLVSAHFSAWWDKLTFGLLPSLSPETLGRLTQKTLARLPRHVPVLYGYMDDKLELEATLHEKMLQMTPRQFERVLHPIFEEDELTLIVAGAVLGFAAGLVQQGLETGAISLPAIRDFAVELARHPRRTAAEALRRARAAALLPFQGAAGLFSRRRRDAEPGDGGDDAPPETN